MGEEGTSKTVLTDVMTVLVHCGVHGRVAVQLAEIAEDNDVDLTLNSGGEEVSCASILELLGLALVEGTRVTVRAEGKKASQALAAVRILLMGENSL